MPFLKLFFGDKMILQLIKTFFNKKKVPQLIYDFTQQNKLIDEGISSKEIHDWEVDFFKKMQKETNQEVVTMVTYLEEYYMTYFEKNNIKLTDLSKLFLFQNKYDLIYLNYQEYCELLDFLKKYELSVIEKLNERMRRAIYVTIETIELEENPLGYSSIYAGIKMGEA